MALSDKKYSELRKDQQISEAIAMIKSTIAKDKVERIKKEQEHYTGYADYLSKSINTLENLINDSNAMDILKIDKYLQFYLNDLIKSNYVVPKAVSALEKLKNDSYLTSLLDFNIKNYIQYQIDKLKKSKKSFLKSRPRRIGYNTERNRWLQQIILRLKSLGMKKQSDIIDFIFRLYREFNILDLEYKIDNIVKNYKDYKFEAKTTGSYNVEKVIKDEYNFQIEIKKIYHENQNEIKSNIRKIVKSVFTD